MKQTIIEGLQGFTPASPQSAAELSIIPLLASQPATHSYLSLHQALQRGSLVITEIDEMGSVPTLKVINKGNEVVLILDGEELRGAKQNRILNTSILVPPKSEIYVPVSCTERGRWHHISAEFCESENVLPSKSRSAKSMRVAENLKRHNAYDADQSMVWQNIGELQHKHKVFSRSDAMADVMDEKRSDLDKIAAEFSLLPEQVGIYVEVAGKFAGLDLVSLPLVWRDLHDKIIRSYAIDLMMAGHSAPPADPANLKHLLDSIGEAEFLPFKSVGLGEDYRLESSSLTGSFLVWEGQPVHYAIYPGYQSAAGERYHSPRGIIRRGRR